MRVKELDVHTIWEQRYQSIVDMEAHLHRNGTRIIKFFLHMSKKENARLIIADIILKHYRDLDLQYPQTGEIRQQELQAFRDQLLAEDHFSKR